MTNPDPEASAPAPTDSGDPERKTRRRITLWTVVMTALWGWILIQLAPHLAAVVGIETGNAVVEQPRFAVTSLEGGPITDESLRGKVVLVNFWATWCPPCRAEMPTLDRLQARLGGPDFEVVALSIDQGPQSPDLVQAFYRQSAVKSLAVYLDSSGGASGDLGVAGLPTTLLIDRQGRESGRKIGLAEWDSPEVITLIRGYLATPKSNQPGKP